MIGSRGTTGFLAVALVALGVAGGAHFLTDNSSAPKAASRTQGASVTVSKQFVGRAVPSGFVGLSMEFRGLEAYAGTNPRAVNPVFVQLLRNLANGGQPVLRIGGDGTDWTWWPVPGIAQPGGVKYSLNSTWMAVAKSLAQEVNGRMILGIDLEADSTRIATAEADAMLSRIGSKYIRAFEIGNEPELYGSFSWYKAPNGQHVKGRPSGYGFPQFLSDFSRFAAALPRYPLAGPSSGAKTWMPLLGQFVSAEPRVNLVTVHRYPLKHCSASTVVTDSQLLASSSSLGLAANVKPNLDVAHSHGRALRIDEMNGVSCGGVRGVSDAFASALWSLGTLFALARTGIDGVNIHTVPNTINEIIGTTFSHGHWVARVHPEYYGMMMFAQAAPPGSRFLKIYGGGGGGFNVWATLAPDHNVRVVFINSSTSTARSLTIRIPLARGSGTLERLQAPHVSSTSGVTLGGQSFGSETSTGQLAGNSQASTVAPVGGTYAVRVPAASAALLTLPTSG